GAQTPLPIRARTPMCTSTDAQACAGEDETGTVTTGAIGMSLGDRLRKLDRVQQHSRWLSFPLAVIKKFGDDGAGQLAALIAYYGFVSLFPLLLVLVPGLGFVLEGDPKTQAEVLHSTLGQFPIIGDQLQRNIH